MSAIFEEGMDAVNECLKIVQGDVDQGRIDLDAAYLCAMQGMQAKGLVLVAREIRELRQVLVNRWEVVEIPDPLADLAAQATEPRKPMTALSKFGAFVTGDELRRFAELAHDNHPDSHTEMIENLLNGRPVDA